MKHDDGIKSVVKVVQLLDTFTVERPELSLSELSTACGLLPPTARRLLKTCEAVGMVAQDPVTRRYRLGMKLFELGHRVAEQMELSRIAHPFLVQAVEATGESAYLSLFDRNEVVYIERVESAHSVQLTSYVGERLPAHTTGTGKVFLAHFPPYELDDFLSQPLKRYSPKTICDPETLRAELAVVLQRGFATTFGEHDEDTFSVAVPVFGHEGKVIAGIGMSGPTYRVKPEQVNSFARGLLTSARQLSIKMGARFDGTETNQ